MARAIATIFVLALAGAAPLEARGHHHGLFGARHGLFGHHHGHPINAWMGSRRVRLR